MGCEIRAKGGKVIGYLADSLDEEDYVVVGNKKIPLSEVQSNKELRDSFNSEIKQLKDD